MLYAVACLSTVLCPQEAADAEATVTLPDGTVASEAMGESAQLLEAGSERSDGHKPGGCAWLCDCTPIGDGWRSSVRAVMLSDRVSGISTGFVVFNLFVMCLPYAGQSQMYAMAVDLIGKCVTWIFILEMALKLVGMGCAEYWMDGWNTIDGVIVGLSIGEMVLTAIFAGGGVNISFLRMLRLLRLLRLLRAWPGLYKIVMAFVKAVPQISNLLVLLFLLMTIFALLGMQVCGLRTRLPIRITACT